MSAPIEQVKQEISELEAEREQLSGFQEIKAVLKDKRKQVDVWTMIMADKAMQAKLLEQIQASGLAV